MKKTPTVIVTKVPGPAPKAPPKKPAKPKRKPAKSPEPAPAKPPIKPARKAPADPVLAPPVEPAPPKPAKPAAKPKTAPAPTPPAKPAKVPARAADDAYLQMAKPPRAAQPVDQLPAVAAGREDWDMQFSRAGTPFGAATTLTHAQLVFVKEHAYAGGWDGPDVCRGLTADQAREWSDAVKRGLEAGDARVVGGGADVGQVDLNQFRLNLDRETPRWEQVAERYRVRDWKADVVSYVCRDHRVRSLFRADRDRKAADVRRAHPEVAAALGKWVDSAEVEPGPHEESDWAYKALLGGDRWKTSCKQGRYHTPFTALRGELRGRVTLKGERLYAVDVKNSQPLLLALTLKQSQSESSCPVSNNANALESVAQNMHNSWGIAPNNPSQDQRPIPAAQGTICSPVPGSNWTDAFLSLCCRTAKGDGLYEALADRVNSTRLGFDRPLATRAEVKEDFFVFAYDDGGYDTPVSLAANFLFPGIVPAMDRFKAENGGGAALACAMQSGEARIMLDSACGRLTREHPRLPYLTVHDAIVAPEWAMKYVEPAVADAWREAHGVKPALVVKEWR